MDRIEFFLGFPIPEEEPADYEDSGDEEDEEDEEDEGGKILGHVLDNDWDDRRYYASGPGMFPVLFKLDGDGCNVSSNHPDLPVFPVAKIETARCFKPYFEHPQYDPRDLGLALFFIEFSLEELKDAGVEVPSNLKGYKFNPCEVTFEQVERPTTPCDWDPVTQRWMPFCTAPGCASGKLCFDDHQAVVSNPPVCTHLLRNIDEVKPYHRYMHLLFSRFGGPYCDCNCYCTNCREFHLPSERKKHNPYKDGSGWPCD
jgi:hypothetical protein